MSARPWWRARSRPRCSAASRGSRVGCPRAHRDVEEDAGYRPLDCSAEDADVRAARVVEEASQCLKCSAPHTIFTSAEDVVPDPRPRAGRLLAGRPRVGMKEVGSATTAAEAIRMASVAHEPVECVNGKKLTRVEPAVTFRLVHASDMRWNRCARAARDGTFRSFSVERNVR